MRRRLGRTNGRPQPRGWSTQNVFQGTSYSDTVLFDIDNVDTRVFSQVEMTPSVQILGTNARIILVQRIVMEILPNSNVTSIAAVLLTAGGAVNIPSGQWKMLSDVNPTRFTLSFARYYPAVLVPRVANATGSICVLRFSETLATPLLVRASVYCRMFPQGSLEIVSSLAAPRVLPAIEGEVVSAPEDAPIPKLPAKHHTSHLEDEETVDPGVHQVGGCFGSSACAQADAALLR